MLLGVPIAYHKAVLAHETTWIGIKLSCLGQHITAEVPKQKVEELEVLIKKALASNVIAIKSLRTLIGKVMSIATVIYVWRPFVQELYAALYETNTRAPPGCVWVKQIYHSLQWLLCFLAGEQGGIIRKYSLAHYLRLGPQVRITWDASPYGMGATLEFNGVFKEYFTIPISQEDQDHLEVKAGTSHGQQAWEALCGLIALRLWQGHWMGQRARLCVRSDNMAALTVFGMLRAKSKALLKISREFSLDLGQAEYRPDLVQHVPGVANQVNDMLSRRLDPGKTYTLPAELANAVLVEPPPRPKSWWRAARTWDPPVEPAATKRVDPVTLFSPQTLNKRVRVE